MAQRDAEADGDVTMDEARNGWDGRALVKYRAEREAAAAGVITRDPRYRPQARQMTANSFRPAVWGWRKA